MTFDPRLNLALVFAMVVQAAGALSWAGAVSHRVSALEQSVYEQRAVSERLARLETQMGAVRTALDRIEERLDDRR